MSTESGNPIQQIRDIYESFIRDDADGLNMLALGEALNPLTDPDGFPLSPTAEAVLAERLTHPGRGYDAEHDEGHFAEILSAADSYRWYFGLSLSCADETSRQALAKTTKPPMIWPWDWSFWHPSPDPVRNLVKACALYAAAGDALKRKADNS